jgi:hypothetical protein
MRAETQIQFINFSQEEFTELISKSVKSQFEELVKESTKEQPQNDSEIYLTRKETAEFFKVSLVTVHSWMKSGIIRPLKIGNKTMFNKAELIKVVESSNRF